MFNNYIIKGIGGFYYVKTENLILECKAKGIFRKQKVTPMAGDFVELEIEGASSIISKILPRKNSFLRPLIANVDNFFIIVSTTEPVPSTLIIDTLCAIAVDKNATPIIVITKSDLSSSKELKMFYDKSGIVLLNSHIDDDMNLLKELLGNKISVFCGNSGVGKSTLLAALLPKLNPAVGAISKKLGRGKHTTREVELFDAYNGLLADTPGFASLEMVKAADITKESLQFAFTDIAEYFGKCKFTGCSHTCEKGCAVINALNDKLISQSRYTSYVTLYGQAKEVKDWER